MMNTNEGLRPTEPSPEEMIEIRNEMEELKNSVANSDTNSSESELKEEDIRQVGLINKSYMAYMEIVRKYPTQISLNSVQKSRATFVGYISQLLNGSQVTPRVRRHLETIRDEVSQSGSIHNLD